MVGLLSRLGLGTWETWMSGSLLGLGGRARCHHGNVLFLFKKKSCFYIRYIR